MKIADSSIAMAASHSYSEVQYTHERLEFRRGNAPAQVQEWQGEGAAQGRPLAAHVQSLTASASSLTLSAQAQSMQVVEGELDEEKLHQALDVKSQFKVSIIKMLLEHMTGKQMKVLQPGDLEAKTDGEAVEGAHPPAHAAEGQPPSAGFALRYEYHEYYREAESTQFTAEGVARTEDGREINFNVELNMSREFVQEQHLQITAGDALKDPLVLNFNGNAAELTERNFTFDLDVDGTEDQIAFVGAGSGFLALDKNNDGEINDGSELFGPTTGNGFEELAKYDKDANNWIDENDAVYDKLRIWSQDSAGNLQLEALGAKNVGAIYLGHVATPFEMNNADNEQLGQLRSSGVFLEEEGGVGTIQQVDLVV